MTNSDPSPVAYRAGLADDQYGAAARLYDQAFGAKLSLAIPDDELRQAVLEQALDGDFAITASRDGRLVGLAGFHTPTGSLTGGIGAGALIRQTGLLRGLRAAAVFGLYERKPQPGQLLMDGIAVDEGCRGQGIGRRLLGDLVEYARDEGYGSIRLDVIDTNPGARRLYERLGFVAVRTERFGWLRWLLGFGGATTMELRVGEGDAPDERMG